MTTITRRPFGKLPAGGEAEIFTLKNEAGMEASVSSYGGIVTSIRAPGRGGRFDDVVLGYDDLAGYLSDGGHFGATVGRYANRIAKGRFTLNGKTYALACNDGNNHLHGGPGGFDHRLWRGEAGSDETGANLTLRLHSPDGEEGYPGALDVAVTFSLSGKNELILHYRAKSDADTLCNLTNHSYFNLAGHASGAVLSQRMKLFASHFTPADSESIPTGEIADVAGTPMDFRAFHALGERIDDDFEQLRFAHGYDHNWVLDKAPGVLGLCAQAFDEASGRLLTCETTLPCVQLYTANFLENVRGKAGAVYPKRGAFCIETQFAPDSPNKPAFASPVLRAGENYDQTTVYRFEVKE